MFTRTHTHAHTLLLMPVPADGSSGRRHLLSVDSNGTCCLWDEGSCQHLGSAVVGELQGILSTSLDIKAAVLVGRWARLLLLLLLLQAAGM